jgi:endonuclease I
MKKQYFTIIISMILVSIVWAGTVPPDSTIFAGQTGITLINSLVASYKSTTNLGYDVGRDSMYGAYDKLNDSLECVYSGYKIYMQPGQDPVTWAYDHDINCEHTWPQSMLVSSTAKADLHHLFPTEIQVNGDRGTLPFGDIPDNQTNKWYRNNVITTTIPASNIEQYAELLTSVRFEPREIQKGNTARAMYYVLTMWQLGDTNLSWWTGQKNGLYAWHVNDAADAREITRTRRIAAHQQNKPNPFVLDSTLIRRAYFPALGVEAGADDRELAKGVKICPNQPNPFSNSTAIRFSLTTGAAAEFAIYDVSGRRVYSWTKKLNAGENTVNWNGRNEKGEALPNGVYMFRFQANGKPFATGRMVLVK